MALKNAAARTVQRAAFLMSRGAGALALASFRLRNLEAQLQYGGDENDIFIVSYPKSGTAWVQMILFQLTTDGSMNIPHIDTVIPHFEEALTPLGRRVSDLKPPRIVKTHLWYRRIPKGVGRYIYVMRDGRDVAVSYFHQLRGTNFAEFLKRFLSGNVPYGSWFKHVSAWLENRKHLRIHVVKYEDLTDNLERAVRRIADFCDITINEQELPRILHNCSFEFMRQHEKQFNLMDRAAALYGPPPLMVRKGKVGSWREEFDNEMLENYYAACNRHFTETMLSEYRLDKLPT